MMQAPADVTSAASVVCERKPTRPKTITPSSRPATCEVSPTGSRKLPEATLHNNSATKKRNLVLECDLALSDDDCMEPPPSIQRSTIITSPHYHPTASSLCKHLFVKGSKKGTRCDRKTAKGRDLCGLHLVKPANVSQRLNPSVPDNTVQVLKSKVETLEKLVLNLIKDSSTPTNKKDPKPTAGSSTVAPPTTGGNPKFKPRPLQRIRLYKLNPEQTYLLVGYKSGMPIFKSKNRLYQVKLPKHMQRSLVPNGRWSLVLDDAMPQMVWKEI